MEEARDSMTGECEGFIAGVLRVLKAKQGFNPRAALDKELLVEAQIELKLEWYSGGLRAVMPPCLNACESFGTEVLKRVARKHSTEELRGLINGHTVDLHFMWQEALKVAMEESDKLSCPICMESFIQIPEDDGILDTDQITELPAWKPTLRTTEHWSSNPCGHVACSSCMQGWAVAEISQQKTRVKCPAPGCPHVLWDHDLKALVSEDDFGRFMALKNTDHIQKLKDDLKDPALAKWLKANSKPCPDCHVIVSRSEGCNQMQCVCGSRFCYRCGLKSCNCGIFDSSRPRQRVDVWDVAS